MKALLIKKSAYVGSYIALALLMEFITFNAIGALPNVDFGILPEYFLIDLVVLLMLAVVVFIIPSFTVQAIFIMALLGIQVIFGFMNESLLKSSGYIFTFDKLALAGEMGGAYNDSFMNYPLLLGLITIFLIEGVLLFLLKRYRVKQNFKFQTVISLLVIFAVVQMASSSVYNIVIERLADVKVDDKFYFEDYYLLNDVSAVYDELLIPREVYKKFGTFGFYYKNISNVVRSNMTKSTEEANEIRSQLNGYFAAQNYSLPTVATGSFAGSNLVMIMIESGEWYGINQKFTPTLYALAGQGVSATNYHSRNKTNHSESLGILGSYPLESMFIKNIVYKDYILENDFSFTLPSALKSLGYQTTYLHNNFHTFYSRDLTHPEFGFDKAYFLEDMPLMKGSGLMDGHPKKVIFDDWDKDSLLFSTNLDRIAPESDNFFTFLTTAIMHGGYDDLIEFGNYPYTDVSETTLMSQKQSLEFSDKCVVKDMEEYYQQITRQDFDELFASLGIDFNGVNKLSEEQLNNVYLRYKRYQAAFMDLDKGLEELILHLNQEGELKDTAIVMYADHSAYFNSQHYFLKGIAEGEYYNPALYKVPFYIYHGSRGMDNGGSVKIPATQNPWLEGVSAIDRFAGTFDLVPTVLDLFGFTFNTGLYHGSSVFSADNVPPSVFWSMESGIFDGNFFTNDGINFLYGGEKSEDLKKEFILKVNNYLIKQQKLEIMYKYDFFAYSNLFEFANIGKVLYRSQI